jgi:Flp pilus assembly protein TadG
MVEFAIEAPLLLTIVFTITSLSQIWGQQTSLNDAIRDPTGNRLPLHQ